MMRIIPMLVVGISFVIASPANAQISSANNQRLRQLLQQFPQADSNRDGVLTIEEAFAFGREAGVIPNTGAQGQSTNQRLPKQSPEDIQTALYGKWKVYRDVQYDTKHKRNVLDFYQADSKTPTPIVVYFHGGGFRFGDKSHVTHGGGKLLKMFLEAGISVVSCNYPFLNDADYMTIMRHCGRSIQFIRSKHKEWNIDPVHIGAYGVSAGSLISEWIAYSPDIARRGSNDPIEQYTKSLAVVGAHLQPMGTELAIPFMKAGGPPIFIYANSSPSDAVHDPKYSKMIKQHADRMRITAVLVGGGMNDIPPAPNNVDPLKLQFDFFLKYLVPQMPEEKVQQIPFRKWTDSTGRFSIEAKVIEVNGERITLKQKNGQVVEVAIDSLSRTDNIWLKANRHKLEK